MSRSVAITGCGAVTPVGRSAVATWEAIYAGESGASRIERFDPESAGLRTHIACEVGAVDAPADVDERTTGRAARYGLVAAHEALTDAGYDPDGPRWNAERVGTSVACALGGMPEIEQAVQDDRLSARFLLTYLPNMVGNHLSMAFNARGPARTQAAACAAGTHAIADAVADIRHDRADLMLAGGAEAAVSPIGVESFERMRALSSRTADPTRASRPFDADRDGFVLGEGSGILVLEAAERARARGAPIYALLSGTGLTADAHHPTRPPESGSGLRRAIERALSDSGTAPDRVDHVNAHGTSTPAGDAAEATALNDLFERSPPTTSNKSQLGHALGGAGAIEAVIAAQTLASGTLPPTINYETPDPACDLPIVTEPETTDPDTVVSTSAGFGGTNGALVFESAGPGPRPEL